MKIVRILVGTLAALFVLMHLIMLPNFLTSLDEVREDLRVSLMMGKGVAMFVGAGVAILCFRKPKDKPPTE